MVQGSRITTGSFPGKVFLHHTLDYKSKSFCTYTSIIKKMASYGEEDWYYDEPGQEQDEEPHSKMMDYHPYSKGRNPMHTRGSDSQTLSYLKQGHVGMSERPNFCAQVHQWLKEELKKLGEGIVLALVPGHKEDPKPNGLAHKIVQKLEEKCKAERKALPFQQKMILVRTKTVRKSATSEGPRSKLTHRGTIEVSPNSPDCSGKVVVILDDVWTSGSTLQVCEEVVRRKFPQVKDVKLIAIGRTVSM